MAQVQNGAFGQQNANNGKRSLMKSMNSRPGMFGTTAIVDTYLNMKAGDDFGTAAIKGVASGMLWTAAPGMMMAYTAARTAPSAIVGWDQYKEKSKYNWYRNFQGNFGGNYQDTQRAMTMRQAAVQQIQGSKLNARSALGGEARILAQGMHRG